MSENYVNLYKDDETIRLTVLSNICRMMIRRGVLDINKHTNKNPGSGPSESGDIEQISKMDPIDNNSFLKHIGKRSDNGVYVIPTDVHFKDDMLRTDEGKRKDENIDFDGSKLVVKIIPQKITDITNSQIINDFLKTHVNHHKLMVFDSISEKAHASIRKHYNLEAFDKDSLMMDLMSYICAPIGCMLVNTSDMKHIINPKIAKIHENDPMARYYSAKKGDIVRIIRASANNSMDVAYRRVIDPKPVSK